MFQIFLAIHESGRYSPALQ